MAIYICAHLLDLKHICRRTYTHALTGFADAKFMIWTKNYFFLFERHETNCRTIYLIYFNMLGSWQIFFFYFSFFPACIFVILVAHMCNANHSFIAHFILNYRDLILLSHQIKLIEQQTKTNWTLPVLFLLY